MRIPAGWFTLALACLVAAPAAVAQLLPSDLKCESLTNPAGIDATAPRLSWLLESSDTKAHNKKQTAYQILVAGSEEALQGDKGDLWDSGKVASGNSIQIQYAGKPLTSREAAWWKVRSWDESGAASNWSAPAHWSMGLLSETDWKAKWIGLDMEATPEQRIGDEIHRTLPARMLRKEFHAHGPVKQATAYISGLGIFELSLNGRKVSDEVLAPALSDYEKRVYYRTYDVTSQVKQGANAIGVMLGSGRFYALRPKDKNFGFPKLLMQLDVTYADGSTETIATDESWKLTADGPITAQNEYDGERYDARKEQTGWNTAGFNDSAWRPAELVTPPAGVLAAQEIAPIRVTETLKPKAISEPAPGVYIFDMGQNMVGWTRLTVSGPKGTAVTLAHAETLKPDGTLYTANLRSANAQDIYTLKGEGTEVYEPRFTYHGFRYVQVTGYPGKPTLATLTGQVVHDDMTPIDDFTTSNELLNSIHHNILWGAKGNYRSMPTDCPQRDERQGWLGDRGASSLGESYLFDVSALYSKWMTDVADSQRADGALPDVAPPYWSVYNDDVTWPYAFLSIHRMLYEQYGDKHSIERDYPAMQKWMTRMESFVKEGITAKDTYGDWCVPPESPDLIHSKDPLRKTEGSLLATAYFYSAARLMAENASLLSKPQDAAEYNELADRLKVSFNRKYFHAETNQYANDSQTSSILPLAFGLVPDGARSAVFEQLVKKIEEQNKGHVGTGLLGAQFLMRTLTENGRPDLAYEIAAQDTYPSWGYMVRQGATTVWELWNGNTANPEMNSGNHMMLVGDLNIWFYEDLAGIKPDPVQPGFQHFLIRPSTVEKLSFVRASHLSPYGKIVSSWKRDGSRLTLDVTVPVNTTATVYVPSASADGVKVNGKLASAQADVKFVRAEAGAAVYEVGSGQYTFVTQNLGGVARK
ncbi:MAG TPA: glycoside hydrolase family 78 protein [Acidisarcina sp.]|nr:glycoside hydrolase family 78 protein [Acidisarcina sp.]